MTAETRLLLVGAGHAHLHLLRQADQLRRAGYVVTLVAPPWFDYSGAAAGVAVGARDPAVGRIDVARLAQGGVEHRPTRVTRLDADTRAATCADGEQISWDVVSLNIGSVAATPPGLSVHPDVVRVKPLDDLHRLREHVATHHGGAGLRVSVVGAGPSGIELAAQLALVPHVARVTVLESGASLGAFLPTGAASRLARLLDHRGVVVRCGVDLVEVGASRAVLRDGTEIVHDVAVLATGLAPPPLATAAPWGGPGGLPVEATLQHRDHADVYAAGDCVDFLPGRLARIGVHGVRQGPVLLEALLARSAGGPAPVYTPPSTSLSILDLGGGTALAVRGGRWWFGRASLLLKRAIDRRWLARYRS
ncbi:NAD(P)/FAD-dependent oxidoreductase [Aeromicrobium sp. Sec7.5]|uniref:NAD(P)/FAD-dependent oxidoreductase n=1 Tax=Aeromicrobium sp. Sec7.5 TaxID=3121276 RepID=UPI002FE4A6EC